MNKEKKIAVCKESDLDHGDKKMVRIGKKNIGVFNVDGKFYALDNKCPHAHGNLCEGPVGGTNRFVSAKEGYLYDYVDEGRILRCSLHGWEFDIRTGISLSKPELKAKSYKTLIESGYVYLLL